MIGKLFAVGCSLVTVKILILPQAIAEPLLKAPKEHDFFDWSCVVECWNNWVLKLFDFEANMAKRKILSKFNFPIYWCGGIDLYFVGWLENINKLMTRGLNFLSLETSQRLEPY